MTVDKLTLKALTEIMIRDIEGDLSDSEARNFHQHVSDYEAMTQPAAVLALLAEIDRLKADLAISHAIKEPAGEDVLFQVLDATVGIITRRAYPHALESEAWNAGLKVITDRRAGLVATADLEPKKIGDQEGTISHA